MQYRTYPFFGMRDWLITHANCMDGAMCAVIFLVFGGTREKIIFSSPSHDKVDALVWENRQHNAGRLVLADISISAEAAVSYDGRRDMTIIDHHKSAYDLAKYKWCHIDTKNSKCGSKMFYHWCQAKRAEHVDFFGHKIRKYDKIINAVDDRDRWVNKNEHSANLHTLFTILGQDGFIDRVLDRETTELNAKERFAVECELKNQQRYIDNLRPSFKIIDKHKIGFVNCELRYTSDAGNELCRKHDLACCVLVNGTTVSMRAPKSSKLDLSAIAKAYGGGGHKCAAGFQLSALMEKPLPDLVSDHFKLHHD